MKIVPRVIRTATEADAPAVLALVARAYRGEASRAGWTTEADLLDGQRTDLTDVLAALRDPTGLVLLLTEGPRILASVRLSRAADGAVLVGMFAVEPALQGGGVGRQVLEAAEAAIVRELGATRGRMTVLLQRSELLAWYARRGWLPSGAREPFPYGDARFGLPRREDLEFLVLEKALDSASVLPPA